MPGPFIFRARRGRKNSKAAGPAFLSPPPAPAPARMLRIARASTTRRGGRSSREAYVLKGRQRQACRECFNHFARPRIWPVRADSSTPIVKPILRTRGPAGLAVACASAHQLNDDDSWTRSDPDRAGGGGSALESMLESRLADKRPPAWRAPPSQQPGESASIWGAGGGLLLARASTRALEWKGRNQGGARGPAQARASAQARARSYKSRPAASAGQQASYRPAAGRGLAN